MTSNQLNIVVYDEREHFKNHDHPSFNYPYTKSKTKVATLNLNIQPEIKNPYDIDVIQLNLQ